MNDSVVYNGKTYINVEKFIEKDKEIERLNEELNDYEKTKKEYSTLFDENIKLLSENKRLNNLINRLEKGIEESYHIEIKNANNEANIKWGTSELHYTCANWLKHFLNAIKELRSDKE